MDRICIGIPCYDGVTADVLDDYMRFAFHLGRRFTEFEFAIAIKSKSEQFRARNAIVESAMSAGCKYLFFMDDDHIIDWEASTQPTDRYDFLRTLVKHMESDPKLGIVGAMYYQRGDDHKAVFMYRGKDDGYYWPREHQIEGKLQEVDATGGGAMLIHLDRMVHDVGLPWFEPEQSQDGANLGTDLQVCQRAKSAGLKVAIDTSIILGHIMDRREIVTPVNRNRLIAEKNIVQSDDAGGGPTQAWETSSMLQSYRDDVMEYMDMGWDDIVALEKTYPGGVEMQLLFNEDKANYYRKLGPVQLARQVTFHLTQGMILQAQQMSSFINTNIIAKGLDFGCGSAPIGFEFAKQGHFMDFIDLDGAYAYEFLKWRCKKHGLDNVNFEWGKDYDYVLLLDALEHIEDWKGLLDKVIDSLKDEDGFIVINYFMNPDYTNIEHISISDELKEEVKQHLVSQGVYPVNPMVWIKRDLSIEAVSDK